MSAGHIWLAVWKCAGHQDHKWSACMWDAACMAVQGLWPRHRFPGCVRDFHHAMSWGSPCRLTILIFLLVKYTLLLPYFCKHLSLSHIWLIVPRRLEWLRVDLPALFRFYVNYWACLPQCDYIHTFPRFRSVLWKFITLCFNRFCCKTSVNWHICPFSVRNILLTL